MQFRVLILTNAVPPAMPADGQRARMLADSLGSAGWAVEVLSPSERFQNPIYLDPASRALRPKCPVHEVEPAPDRFLKLLGMRSLAWRALIPLYRRGMELLSSKRFDLVYISTSQFNFFCIGRLWLRKTGVPYILDFQDPWYRPQTGARTTNVGWKQFVTMHLARVLERFALAKAAAVVAVSPRYLQTLSNRYPHFPFAREERGAVLPFGVAETDFTASGSRGPALAPSKDSVHTVAYVGAGGGIMAKSFRRICRALAMIHATEPALLSGFRIELAGTSTTWKPGDPRELLEVARSCGVDAFVGEEPSRIGYVEAVSRAGQAQGVLVLGVDDPAYMPSKLFLYALTRKPLLASLHRQSQANTYFQRFPDLGSLIHFDADDDVSMDDVQTVRRFLIDVRERQEQPREEVRRVYSSEAISAAHARFFEGCLAQRPSGRYGE